MGPQGPADDPSRRLILHESVGRFLGWSLVASVPGLGVARDPAAPPEGKDPQAHPDFKLATTLKPTPGSVPVLRFGRPYRIRARMAYLGGAGPEFVPGDTSQDFAHATEDRSTAGSSPCHLRRSCCTTRSPNGSRSRSW